MGESFGSPFFEKTTMAQVKIYEMPGCISCRLKFTLGKAQPFEAFFDGGIPDKNYPAVYAARTIGQQLAIENSEYFKNGKIRLRKEKGRTIRATMNPTSPAAAQAPAVIKDEESAPAPGEEGLLELKRHPEITTLVDAIAFLKSEFAVSASRLKTEASVLRVAEEKGVSFPNLNK